MTPQALPTGRRGQGVALAILGALVSLLWFSLIAPIAAWYAARADDIDQHQTTIDHLTALAARLPALEHQFAAGVSADAAAQGASDARAGADLQQRIEAMAEAAGAHLASVEFLPPEPADGYRRIPLRVSVTTRWPVLTALLAAVETAEPPLHIDDLHIRAAGAEGDPTPAAEASFLVIMLRAAPVRPAA